ncbi:hypothetical protein [Rhizobium ruizarguesonis]
MRFIVYLGLLGALSMVAPLQAQAETITFEQGADCRKNTDKGCTGDEVKCYNAPADRIIMRSTMKMETGASGKNGSCGPTFGDMKSVAVTTAGGGKFTITEPSKLCVRAHIESGSGYSNLGKGFNVKCKATFELEETN